MAFYALSDSTIESSIAPNGSSGERQDKPACLYQYDSSPETRLSYACSVTRVQTVAERSSSWQSTCLSGDGEVCFLSSTGIFPPSFCIPDARHGQ